MYADGKLQRCQNLWSNVQLTETIQTYDLYECYNAVKRLHSTYNFHFS